MNLQKSALIALLLTPSISFAFFCPNNFNQIDFGYTIEQVTQQCGKPDKEDKKEVEKAGPQEWSYYLQQKGVMQINTTAQGALKTQMAFDSGGKLMSISVNGIGVRSTNLCGSTVQLGDSKENVKAACGDPGSVSKGQSISDTSQSQQKIKVTEFTYNTNPPVKLIFENGILKDKR